METITLNIKSPSAPLTGLNEFISRMERADALIDKLAKPKPISVTFAIHGSEQLEVFGANIDSLAAGFRALGQTKIGDQLEKQILSPGEAAQRAGLEVDRLKMKLKELSEIEGTARGKFFGKSAYSVGDLDQLASQRKKLDELTIQRQGVQEQMVQMAQLQGAAAAMSGGDPKTVKSLDATTAAEKKLAPAAEESADALARQHAVVEAKMRSMDKLTASLMKATAAERQQAVAAEVSAQANTAASQAAAKGALLVEKIRTDKEGEATTTRKFRTGAGATLTESSGGTVAERNTTEAFKRRAEQLEAEFAARRAIASEEGSLAGSPNQIALLREEARARRELVTAMEQQSLGSETLADKQRVLAANADSKAATAEARSAIKSRAEQEKEAERASAVQERLQAQQQRAAATDQKKQQRANEVAQKQEQRVTLQEERAHQDQINRALRERAALLERSTARQAPIFASAGAGTRATMLRERANAIEALVADFREYGSDSGRDPVLRMMETRAAKIRGQADRLETAMTDALTRNAELSRRMQLEFSAFGGKEKRVLEQQTGDGGRVTKQKSVRANPVTGVNESIELIRRFDAAGRELAPTMTRANNALSQTGRGVTSVGASFARNVASVTAWSAAVATLYSSLAALGYGFSSAVQIERQFATLTAVFRGNQEEARALGMQALELAAQNGRAGEEAVDAAIRWSRLGLSQTEAAEAVAVSLQAANVAELTAAESAEQLSSIFAAYRLEVSDLRVVLNELNTVSNTLNVTNKDLLGGIARTGAIAKQAGIPIAELIGLIGAGVSRTGRSGAEIGNALKSIIVAISNPELQTTLREGFQFDVKTPLGELKNMSEILAELFVRVQSLDQAGRAEILQKIGGKQQASRLQALLDGYVTSQVKAIQAQRDLTSADREGALIRDTMVSQLQTLTTEWQRLFTVMLSVGGETSILNTLTGIVTKLSEVAQWVSAHPGVIEALFTTGTSTTTGKIVNTPINTVLKALGKPAELLRGGPGGADLEKQEAGRQRRVVSELARLRAEAGASEQNARLARNLARGIGPLAKRDQTAALRAAREASAVFGDTPQQRAAISAELSGMIERNNLDGARNKMLDIAAKLTERGKKAREDESVASAKEIELLENKVKLEGARLDAAQRRGESGDPQRRALEATEQKLERMKADRGKTLYDDYGELEGFDPLAAVKEKFAERSQFRVEALRGFFENGPGIGDTATDEIDRKLRGLGSEREYLSGLEASSLTATRWGKNNDGEWYSVGAGIPQQQLNSAIREEVTTRRAALAIEEEQLRVQRAAAVLQDRLTSGVKEAAARSAAFATGGTEGEGLVNEFAGIRDRLLGDARERGGASRFVGDQIGEQRAQGELIGYANRLLEIQAGINERRYSIERDITNERQKANAEASKALQMASREEQLRAALLQKVTGGRRFTAEGFQFLDQGTREAVEKFTPGSLPGTFDTEGRALDREKAALSGADRMSEAIDELVRSLRGETAKGAGQPSYGPPPGIPNVALNFGTEHIDRITSTLLRAVEGKMQLQIDGINSKVDGFLATLTYAGAQSAGAATVNG